ncbi:MAG TPA: SpoIID/LytB domain-containing protein [Candidatus Baltobacteraceae bacterium]|nr:SpoIID/LytB domain-containing protein [Candidatus Baltobacteraceae bacterium]
MRRTTFLALGTGAMVAPAAALAQSGVDADPAITSATPALRVLLGPGSAQPGPQGSFLFSGRLYRGTYQQTAGGVVNLVDIEQYLYSVVPREMSPGWPAAALEAQAVCARTYVLARSNPRRAYDLVPSELDQVYQGVAGESPAGRTAVDATVGQVLHYDNLYASVAYSSCCGGHTEASSDAWGSLPVPYLGGVRCTYCTASPNFHWTSDIALSDVAMHFGDRLAAFGELRGVRVAATDPSGRARSFELDAERGSANIKGSTFRMSVGPRVVKSLLITNMLQDGPSGSLTVEGAGLGHGVGLCQWGARGMALAGRSARDILALYFPGTQVSTND